METEGMKDALWYGLMIMSLFFLTWKAVSVVWLRPKKIERWLRQQGLKGNSYKPFVGDVFDLINHRKLAMSTPITNFSHHYLPRILGFLYHTTLNHGKNCFMWIGPNPWLIITEAEKVKEVLTKYEEFQKPKHLTEFLLVGLFGLEGHQWVKHRRIINPAFHLHKLKNMFDAVHESCSTMIGAWEEILSEKGCAEVDVLPFLVNLGGDVISRTAFGTSYEQGKLIFDLQTEHIGLSMGFQVSNYIPGWRYLPTKRNRRVRQICKEVEEVLTRMIDKRKKDVEDGEVTKDDLLGLLLESNMKEIKENGNQRTKGLTTKEVVEECKLFYLAGSETTSSLLVWTLILLSKHQDWQELARNEVLEVFGKDQKPYFDGFNRTKVVNMIVNEVLRLYPPVFMSIRKVYKEIQLKEWLIPAGTEILMPICISHQDCNVWGEDAKEFNPERFSEGISKASKGHQGVFLPFSTGPRNCIGQNFALLEAKLALTLILQNFSFELSSTYTHAPCPLLTITPQYGANLVLHKLG